MAAKTRTFQWVYAGLWLIRIWFALYGTGYIHPDEHMQNGEVTAGNILGLHALTTWEWHQDFPVRSILPTFVTTGLPLLALRLLFGPERLHPPLVFRIQRLAFLCLSSVLDYSVWSLVPQPAPRRLSLLLLASSYVTCTFQVRPFSNSLESVLVSLCIVLFRRIVDKRMRLKVGREKTPAYALKRDLHLLAVLAVIGTFTRPTFVAFALPIAYQLLRLSYQVVGSPFQVVSLLLPPICTAMLAASVFIAVDTFYFRGNLSKPVITPYNFVKYNLSAENLAGHGLHPNWLHAGVNMPMLLGPLFLWFAWCSMCEYVKPSGHRVQKVYFETDILRRTLIQIIILSLSVLSLQPHQEPRFLTPLILPAIVLLATTELPRPGKFFWVTWITFNTLLALVFGVLHQGGVVPSILALHSTLRNGPAGSSTHIIYWKTYTPPRHLLGVSRGVGVPGKISFVDLSGAPQNELMAALSAQSSNSTYLVTPVPMYSMLPQGISSCMVLKKHISPHLDLDHIPESILAGHDALSLGIYAVERGCIAVGLATQEHL
ncbi:hypothetical protein OG21DRAFT_1404685 [Imleria badia]|nr:hypothetical protein OG21DRAFT_1404685 [Imleria badia]